MFNSIPLLAASFAPAYENIKSSLKHRSHNLVGLPKRVKMPKYMDFGHPLPSPPMTGYESGSSYRKPRRNNRTPKRNLKPKAAGGGTPASATATTQTSTGNISSLTSKQTSQVLKRITNTAELEASKRSTQATYRLHAAKYLKMDAMLKNIMFPLHRFRGFFGFTSTSGQGMEVAHPLGDPLPQVGQLAPRSSFRGISFFKLRHTLDRHLDGYPDLSSDSGQAQVLNAERYKVGTTQLIGPGDDKIFSYFRRFTNGPDLVEPTAPAPVPATFTAAGVAPSSRPLVASSMSRRPTNYKQLPMDFNCADIERISLAESSFLPLITASTGQGGAGEAGSEPWAGVSAGSAGYDTGVKVYDGDNSQLQLKPALKDAVVRIADGKVSMDICNGTRVPTVVEIVIHSMKKRTANVLFQSNVNSTETWNTRDIYQSIWKAADWAASEKSAFGSGTTNPVAGNPSGQSIGGWNTFWDPKTPFLKVNGPGKKFVDDIANEVHRSMHYLAPGEAKTVNFLLGSLYYKIGGRSGGYETVTNADTNSGILDILEDGAGTLAVAVGHFGIDCLETAFDDGKPYDLDNTGNPNYVVAGTSQLGAGFWVGKRPAPSQVVVSGEYSENWYPTYMERSGRSIASTSALASAIGDKYKTAPLGTIAPEQVSTIPGDSFFESIGAGKAINAEQL